ncbi:MAG: hypothetical protein ACJ786_33450 [Catenulispora sp.]
MRVVAVLHALSFVLQPVLAGLFLSGQDGAIDLHATNAGILILLCLIMTILAVPAWRSGLVPRPVFTTSVSLLVVEIVEMIAGSSHILWLHIPLGVIMMGAFATLMPLVMRPQSRPGSESAGAIVTALPATGAAEAAE